MNDERPIEKLLRRAAQERSDEAGAPPELHPANRRVLQDEVAKQFPKPTAPPVAAPTFWELLMQRWAYALGVIAVVGILGLMLLPSLSKSKSKSMELAKSAPATDLPASYPATTTAAQPEPAPALLADSVASNVARSGSGGGNLRGYADESRTITTPPLAPLATSSVRQDSLARREVAPPVTTTENFGATRENESLTTLSRSRTANDGKLASQDSYNRTMTAATPALGVAGRTPTVELGSSLVAASKPAEVNELLSTNSLSGSVSDKSWLARGGGEDRQQMMLNSQAFSNVSQEQKLEKKKDAQFDRAVPPVLTNFKIEQAGRDVRVVDGDGSVYRGVVDEANTVYRQVSAQQYEKQAAANENKFRFQSPKAAAPVQQQAPTLYFYQVTGTNRTLNQNVVFSWNFLPTNETAAAAQLNYKEVMKEADFSKQTSPFPVLLQNSYINGRVQYGEGREMEVNAVPVKP